MDLFECVRHSLFSFRFFHNLGSHAAGEFISPGLFSRQAAATSTSAHPYVTTVGRFGELAPCIQLTYFILSARESERRLLGTRRESDGPGGYRCEQRASHHLPAGARFERAAAAAALENLHRSRPCCHDSRSRGVIDRSKRIAITRLFFHAALLSIIELENLHSSVESSSYRSFHSAIA